VFGSVHVRQRTETRNETNPADGVGQPPSVLRGRHGATDGRVEAGSGYRSRRSTSKEEAQPTSSRGLPRLRNEGVVRSG
jgi:hypothetical protein